MNNNQNKNRIEENSESDEEDNEEYKISDINQDGNYKCKCGKKYRLQSTLHNHIRLKHDNNKIEFEIRTGIKKTGRPKKIDGQDQYEQINKKQKRPEGIDDVTWQIFENQLYLKLNLYLNEKKYLKTNEEANTTACNNQEKDNQKWKEYEIQRDALLKKLKIDKKGRVLLEKQTNFLLRLLGIILKHEISVKVFLSFVKAYIQMFFDLPDEKNELLNKDMDDIEKELYETFYEILMQEQQTKQPDETQQDSQQIQQKDKGDQENQTNQSEINEQLTGENTYEQEEQQEQQLQKDNSIQHNSGFKNDQQNIEDDSNESDTDLEKIENEQYKIFENTQHQTQNQNIGIQPITSVNVMSFTMPSYLNINSINQTASYFFNQQIPQPHSFLQNSIFFLRQINSNGNEYPQIQTNIDLLNNDRQNEENGNNIQN